MTIPVEQRRRLSAEAILFDIDGTLVDSTRAYLEVARVAAEPHGLVVSEEHVRHSLASGSNFWQDVVPRDRADCQAIMNSMRKHAFAEWPRLLREHATIFEGIAQILDQLKQRGFVLGIVSGAHPAVLELLRENDLLARFDAVVLGADVSKPKPDPEGILKCLERLGIAPAAAAYVGDTPIDIQTSRAAGVYSIGVLTGAGNSASMLPQAPDHLLTSLAGLPDCIEPTRPLPCN